MSRYQGSFAKPENALKRAVRFPAALASAPPDQLKPFPKTTPDGSFQSTRPSDDLSSRVVRLQQEELINVGQPNAALQALHDVITSKRHRTWQKVLEQIMFKYVELCIELKKGRLAKDGLIQYRIVCQQVNVNSLEEVIKHFKPFCEDVEINTFELMAPVMIDCFR